MELNKITKKYKSFENNLSVILGIITVLVVGGLIINFVQNRNPQDNQSESSTEVTAGDINNQNSQFKEYTVLKNDSLYSISLKEYGNGDLWTVVAKENQLKNPSVLFVGTKLRLPKIETISAVENVTDTKTNATGQYTVVSGDNLWKICVKYYQDGYKWTKVAKANNLSNPNIIYPGTILTMPE